MEREREKRIEEKEREREERTDTSTHTVIHTSTQRHAMHTHAKQMAPSLACTPAITSLSFLDDAGSECADIDNNVNTCVRLRISL